MKVSNSSTWCKLWEIATTLLLFVAKSVEDIAVIVSCWEQEPRACDVARSAIRIMEVGQAGGAHRSAAWTKQHKNLQIFIDGKREGPLLGHFVAKIAM